MIVGADVTHPSPIEQSIKESIAAVVASIDEKCSYYSMIVLFKSYDVMKQFFKLKLIWFKVARLRTQPARKCEKKSQEMILDIENVFYDLFMQFFYSNQYFPKRVILFRDGISEGEFKNVIYFTQF